MSDTSGLWPCSWNSGLGTRLCKNWSARDIEAQATLTTWLPQQPDALVVQAQITRIVSVAIPSQ